MFSFPAARSLLSEITLHYVTLRYITLRCKAAILLCAIVQDAKAKTLKTLPKLYFLTHPQSPPGHYCEFHSRRHFLPGLSPAHLTLEFPALPPAKVP